MSESTPPVTAPTPGARLKAERERRGMSAQKAADEMHLEAWVIDALESGDYARIGPSVYAKGHLRKYAKILDLPLADIMSDFEPVQPAAPTRNISSIPVGSRHAAPQARSVSPGQATACLAALLVLIGMVWWQPWHQRARTPASGAPTAASAAGEMAEQNASDLDSSDAAAAPLQAAPITADDYAPRTLAATSTGGGAGGGAVSSAVHSAAPGSASGAPKSSAMLATSTTAAAASVGAQSAGLASAAAPAPGAGRARLKLSFTSDSWVDVRDAAGNRSFAGNGSANTVKTIAGTAPLHVYLRSANGVQLEINGRAVAIAPQFFSGDVARFEAGADGVLRRDATASAPTSTRPPG